jgi:tetratricopeptide (TPR) repeat protein
MTSKKTQQDDRNLVENSESGEKTIEGVLMNIWDAHHFKIIAGIVLLFVVVTVYNVGKSVEIRTLAQLQKDYTEALGDAEKELAFADDNANQSLAGVIYFDKGTEAFEAQEWSSAIEFFGKASGALKGTIMEGRALVALAVAQIENGDDSNGKNSLETLVADPTIFKTFRGEAYLKLLVLAIQANDTSAVDSYFEKLNEIEGVDQILARAHVIRSQFEKSAED